MPWRTASRRDPSRPGSAHRLMRFLFAWLLAALSAGVLASIVQTQLNLAALVDMGAAVPDGLRARVTLEDIVRFGPVMTGIAAAALVPAFWLAGRIDACMGESGRTVRCAVIGVIAMAAGLVVLGWFTPMPALVEATRTPIGFALLSLVGVAAGVVFARTFAPLHGDASDAHRDALAAFGVLALLLGSFVLAAPAATTSVTHADASQYQVQTVATGLNRPWSVAILPDGRRLVTEMQGRVLLLPAGDEVSRLDSHPYRQPRPALDLKGLVIHKVPSTGLLDVVLDPGFGENGLVYLSLTYGEGNRTGTGIFRARLEGDDLRDVRLFFKTPQTTSSGNFGGRMAFLPDGTLAVTVGDGLDWRERAQDPAVHLGKILRLGRDGKPATDNPFIDRSDARPDLYSLGHRNPQGIAVDPTTGTLWVSEHGARGGDEINQIDAGRNYGWPVVTAGIDYSFARVTPFTSLAGYRDPAWVWTPAIAPAGLAIYDGALFPAWRGDLFVPALKGRALYQLKREGARIVSQQRLLANLDARIRDVKVAPDGSLYVLTDGQDARLLRIVPARTPLAEGATSF